MKKDLNTATVRDAALEILLKIEKNQAYSNLLINDTIKKMKVPQVDVPLLTELVYGTIQNQMRLDYYLSSFTKKPLKKLDKWVHVLLRMTVYQLVFLDRIPDHAAINEAVEIAKKRGHKGTAGFVNGMLRGLLRGELPSLDKINDNVKRLSVETSHPEWLLKRWINQYGFERAEKTARANLSAPVHSLRVNTARSSVKDVKESLTAEGLEVEEGPLLKESLRLKKGSVINSEAFKQGYVSVQDEGSMLVSHAVDPQPGEKILDACAAPGGKSAHMAERMNNEGEIISIDIHDHKVKLVKEQQKRLNLSVIKGETADARKLHEKFAPETFDKILVDAPCSGLGVIQRKPDLKWSKQEDDILRLSSIQEAIVQSVWPLLKKGGRLVYSTCTIDVEENDLLISRFVDTHEDAVFDSQLKDRLPAVISEKNGDLAGKVQLFPGDFGTDGFFISSVMKHD
ncbi:16S rRNA (cytosine(967)-C(5))-methyltransferase RsmB [Salipaludibacillus aurantiacus]|uniref:16S rRNA (cytosine(967)-C(5))-methyltransferase n=1 Tax=Salipaludibacillus aurantiacus TaxID=1601833 RepID=A0A1H9QQ72_9BACI|nr:16S rRNA (cytosine(967)-C(5))-methyltransferase RsmB [Salipaludibacillus aurantiacus]SER62594.1 16S rRNA (cytosine967-C5)-methyltransferase [Salipaludibacillus aurantiacus]